MNHFEFTDSSACDATSCQLIGFDFAQTYERVSCSGNDHLFHLPLDRSQIFHEVTDKIIRSTYHRVESGYAEPWG